jgi:hypothetical protein
MISAGKWGGSVIAGLDNQSVGWRQIRILIAFRGFPAPPGRRYGAAL